VNGCRASERVEKQATGINADELAGRARRTATTVRGLSGAELESWLLECGLAELNDGLLAPTAIAVEIAGALA
jgi:hypothetical protein